MMPKEFRSLSDVGPDDVLTPKIAAALIHRKAGYIRARIREKKLLARDVGGWLIKGSDFLQWLDTTPKSIDLENSKNQAQPTQEANGASMSHERASARMASNFLRSAIASR
jgi:hypothetical protein